MKDLPAVDGALSDDPGDLIVLEAKGLAEHQDGALDRAEPLQEQEVCSVEGL